MMLENTMPHIGAQNKYAGHDGHGIYYRLKLQLVGDYTKYAVDAVNAIYAPLCPHYLIADLGPTWDITDAIGQLGTSETH